MTFFIFQYVIILHLWKFDFKSKWGPILSLRNQFYHFGVKKGVQFYHFAYLKHSHTNRLKMNKTIKP
jgi:hypothetical protein